MKLDVRTASVAAIGALAVIAPISPSTVLTKAQWPALAVILLLFRRATLADLATIGLAAWVTADALQGDSGFALSNWWAGCLLFLAARAAIRTASHARMVGWAYLAGCAWAVILIVQDAIERDMPLIPDYSTATIRLGVEGVNPNYTAYALASGVVVAAVLALRPGRTRHVAAAFIPLFSYAVVGTGTRGAQIGIVLALAYLLLSRWAPRAAWKVVAVGSPALLAAVAFGVYGDQRLLWVQEYFGRATTTLSGRTDLWPIARAEWADHFWAGLGTGMFPSVNTLGIAAHNAVLGIGVELGVVGLALWAAAVAAVLAEAARAGSCRAAGLLLVAWTPIWLTGYWEVSPAAWLLLAVVSRFHTPDSGEDFVGVGVDIRGGLIGGGNRSVEDQHRAAHALRT